LPAPSMKEAMPRDAQRSVPGSRAHEPLECYAKFCKLVLENVPHSQKMLTSNTTLR